MKSRSNKQNNALHLMFERLAEELNDNGLDMKKTLKPEVDIPWDKYTIKEYIWRPIMKAITGKESTTELDTKEVDKVFVIINKHLGDKFGIELSFPSIETLMRKGDDL